MRRGFTGSLPPWQGFAADLRARAERAWQWYGTHPRSYNCDTGEIKAGSANLNAAAQDRAEAVAALHLWVLTWQPGYHDAFRQKVGKMRQLADKVWSAYEMGAAEMLYDYLAQPGADRAIGDRITAALARATRAPAFLPRPGRNDLYRAAMPVTYYHWGSNQNVADHGLAASAAVDHGVAGSRRDQLQQRALDLLH